MIAALKQYGANVARNTVKRQMVRFAVLGTLVTVGFAYKLVTGSSILSSDDPPSAPPPVHAHAPAKEGAGPITAPAQAAPITPAGIDINAPKRAAQKAVDAGTLREDLFYRLNVFPIELPPLRERAEDVPVIARHFLRQICAIEGRTKVFTAEALERLSGYHWPGNVRELRNIVYRSYLMAPGSLIQDPCLHMGADGTPDAAAPAISLPLGLTLNDVKRRVTVATFEHLGKREATAATLGISDKSLYLALKDHDGFQRVVALPQAA